LLATFFITENNNLPPRFLPEIPRSVKFGVRRTPGKPVEKRHAKRQLQLQEYLLPGKRLPLQDVDMQKAGAFVLFLA